MDLLHSTTESASHAHAPSRRRVLQGVAWATPAVVLATALPAAAASPPVIGGLAITGASAAMNTANFFVTAAVAYVGDGSPHPDYPVSAVTLTISIPTSRVVAGTPGVTSTLWSYVSTTTSGSNTLYKFQWLGSNLSATASPTASSTFRIPATTSVAAVNIVITANGVSNAIAVPPATQTVAAVLGADLTVDNPAIDWITWMPAPGGGQQNGYRMQGVGRWAGPYNPVGGSITNVQLIIRIPAANTDGTYVVNTLGAGWSLSQAPALSNGFWQASWVYSGTIGSGNVSTTGWDISFKALGAKTLNVVQSALYGSSNGSPCYYAWSGPTS